jgi:hypothetical protein
VSRTPDNDDIVGAADRGLLAHRSTFLVRIQRDLSGAVTGVVEAVRTGEKRPFAGTRGIGPAIDELLDGPGAAESRETEAV